MPNFANESTRKFIKYYLNQIQGIAIQARGKHKQLGVIIAHCSECQKLLVEIDHHHMETERVKFLKEFSALVDSVNGIAQSELLDEVKEHMLVSIQIIIRKAHLSEKIKEYQEAA